MHLSSLKRFYYSTDYSLTHNRKMCNINVITIYINAILNKYLLQYQETPDVFFENSDKIKAEMKIYLDFMLFGICKE